jgi:hypothetical protein
MSQEFSDLSCRQGWGEEITLAEAATHGLKQLQLFFCLDSLGDDIHAENASQLEDGLHDLKRLMACIHALDERAVNLKNIEWKRVKMAQGAVASPKVIHVQGDAEAVEAFEDFCGFSYIAHEAGFRHLQPELVRRESGFEQEGLDMIGQAGTRELPGGKIDTHPKAGEIRPLPLPCLQLAASLV